MSGDIDFTKILDMSKINNHNLLFIIMFIILTNTAKSKNKFVYKHNICNHVKVCPPPT